MLPGFRFLSAAIVLSMSVLIFGLGAAALLRAAHEQFASIPSRRAPSEQVFTRQPEPMTPTLALLRVEPELADKVPGTIGSTAILEAVTPAAPTPEAPQAEPEKLAATEEPTPVEPVKPEAPVIELEQVIQASPVQAPAAETPTANQEVKLAAIAETPPAAAAPAAPEPVVEAPSLANNPAALKIATLGGPAVPIVETAPAKTTSAKPEEPGVNRKRAQRAKERRRAAARRALQARQAAAQQAADPFSLTPARSK